MNPMNPWTLMLILSALVPSPAAAEYELPAGAERVLELPPGEGNPRNSEGDFISLQDGGVMFVYTHFVGGGGDHSAAHLAARRSSDGGKTWSTEDTLVVSNEGGMNVMSVSLLRLKSGPIALFYLRKNAEDDCRPFLRLSTDEGQTWSEASACIAEPIGYYVVNNDRVVQLKSGRLVIPAARHAFKGEKFSGRGTVVFYLSDDEGKTWRAAKTSISPPEDLTSGLQEPGIIELKDGRLMMLARTTGGCQYRSYSTDGGDTWTPAAATDLLSPCSPATFERIPSTGDIFLVWNNHRDIPPDLVGQRTPLSAAISHDEGQTWEKIRNLETDPHGWYCYTAMEFVGEHVLLGLCAGDRRQNGLARTEVLRIPVTWFYEERR